MRMHSNLNGLHIDTEIGTIVDKGIWHAGFATNYVGVILLGGVTFTSHYNTGGAIIITQEEDIDNLIALLQEVKQTIWSKDEVSDV